MKLIVGPGNPGEKYKDNRHNVGYMIVDAFASTKFSIPNFQFSNKFKSQILKTKNFVLVKPETFMNPSGGAVKKLVNFYKVKPDDLYVVHDDLDIKLGEYKIQFATGPKDHNGVNSIEEELGTADFWRVRVGVDNRDPHNRIAGEEYVLQDFTGPEKEILDKTVHKLLIDLKELITNNL